MHEHLSSLDQPIVIGYDRSDNARRAIEHTAALFPGRPATVVSLWHGLSEMMLRVGLGMTETLDEAADEVDAADAEAGRQMAEEGATLARDAGLRAEAHSVRIHKNVWSTLLGVADELQAAVVAVGQRGQSAVEAALLGSVSHGVLHHSHRPVLVVPDHDLRPDVGPLLLCYDGSEASERAIREAGRQLPNQPAQVLTVWLKTRSFASAARIGAPDHVVEVAIEKIDGEAERHAQLLAEEGAEKATQAGFDDAQATARAGEGNVWSTLAHCSEGRRAAAIVIGSRGLGALRSALLGSVSRGVVTHADVPTLVVPPEK
jgi:nucleotide-binding universal stress UspA family protein